MQKKIIKKVKIQKTANYQSLQAICTEVLDTASMGMIFGKSGTGKTTAVRTFAIKNSNVAYYEVPDSTDSKKALLQNILHAMGGISIAKSIAHLRRQIIQTISNNGIELLIVDQANYLSPVNFTILNGIRELAEIGLVIVGTEKLPSLLDQGCQSLELEQFYGRLEYTLRSVSTTFDLTAQFLVALGLPAPLAGESEEAKKDLEEFNKIVNFAYGLSKVKNQLRTVNTIYNRAVQLMKVRKQNKLTYKHFEGAQTYIV